MPLQTEEQQYFESSLWNLGDGPLVFPWDTTGTWSPARDMFAYVLVMGGGGSGGAAFAAGASGTPPRRACASGGGAGGVSFSLLELKKDVTYSYTVGAPGAQVTANSSTPALTGGAGGTSSFSGSGIVTMTANGGNGGNADVADDADNSAAGVTGGTASGGNIFNRTGGGSGDTSSSSASTTATCAAASGGGAAQLFVDPADEVLDGGDAVNTSLASYSGGANSHGAGVSISGDNGSNGGANLGDVLPQAAAFFDPQTYFGSSLYEINSVFGPLFALSGPPETSQSVTGTTNKEVSITAAVRIHGSGGYGRLNDPRNNPGPNTGGLGSGSGGSAVVKTSGAANQCSSAIGGNGAIIILPVKVAL